jgi:hypothetical protein
MAANPAEVAKAPIAQVPPHEPPKAKTEADKYKTLSGFEGREDMLGKSMSVVLKILGNHAGYAHELNDPLVKAHLNAMQFAKNRGAWAEYVAHDVATMAPINRRMRQIIEKTGLKEIALVALFDRTACHYALAMSTEGDGLSRRWKEPFGYVLEQCRRIGQFDLTVEEIHAQWTRPRLEGFGETMGVKLRVSDIDADGWITCSIAD